VLFRGSFEAEASCRGATLCGIDLAGNELQLETKGVEPWRVHLVETGTPP
jgi:hypothetical protein